MDIIIDYNNLIDINFYQIVQFFYHEDFNNKLKIINYGIIQPNALLKKFKVSGKLKPLTMVNFWFNKVNYFGVVIDCQIYEEELYNYGGVVVSESSFESIKIRCFESKELMEEYYSQYKDVCNG
jgi:hypothetical protein